MPTGYEVQAYHNIQRIADAAEKIADSLAPDEGLKAAHDEAVEVLSSDHTTLDDEHYALVRLVDALG